MTTSEFLDHEPFQTYGLTEQGLRDVNPAISCYTHSGRRKMHT